MADGEAYTARLRYARDNPKSKEAREVLKEIGKFLAIAGSQTPQSGPERKAELSKLYANDRFFGGASCFLSLVLDDVNQPTVLRLCYGARKPGAFPAAEGGLLSALQGGLDAESVEGKAFLEAVEAAAPHGLEGARTSDRTLSLYSIGSWGAGITSRRCHVICTDRGLCVSYRTVVFCAGRCGSHGCSARCGRRLCKQYRYDASDLYSVTYMKKNLWLT